MISLIVILASSISLSILTTNHYVVVAYLPRAYLTRNSYHVPVLPVLVQKSRTIPTKTTAIVALSARYIEMPLLDFLPPNSGSDGVGKKAKKEEILVQPLPSIHLQQQPELSSIHVYGMKLTIPLHQQIINHAWDITAMNADADRIDFLQFDDGDDDTNHLMPQRAVVPYNDPTKLPLVGVVAFKPPSQEDSTQHPAIGAIGCVVEVLYNAAVMNHDEYKKGLNIDSNNIDMTDVNKKKTIRYNTPSTSKTVLCRGLFRFIVREIKQSIPYTVALVEELHDGSSENDVVGTTSVDNDNMIRDSYANMTTTELMQRTLQSMQFVMDRRMENAIQSSNQPLTPLEESILQDNGLIQQQQQVMKDLRETAQEYNNLWNIFRSSLVDMTPHERYYSVPFMAAEICHFPNKVRRQMVATTDTIQRLRIACQAATAEVAATSASTRSTIQNPIVSTAMDGVIGRTTGSGNGGVVVTSQTLNVGTPKLPSWSQKIKKGTILEYYWNEDYGWCRGQVIEDPLRIVPDEIVLTMHFPDDDSTHRLPFSAEEKVRWRPPTSSSSSSSSKQS